MGFEIVAYDNGTFSLKEVESGQTMHSRIGPWREAWLLYVEQSRVVDRVKDEWELGPVVLHDVGLGIAANALATLHAFEEVRTPMRILEVHSFETKPEALEIALKNREQFPFLIGYERAIEQLLKKGRVSIKHGGTSFNWTLHTGDYFQTLEQAPPPEVIYYDFYAPKACPDLWTEDRFKQILKALAPRRAKGHSTDLFTYAASKNVRVEMLLAGFFVGYGRATEMKSETTVASTKLERLERPLDHEWLESLGRSDQVSDEAVERLAYHSQFR